MPYKRKRRTPMRKRNTKKSKNSITKIPQYRNLAPNTILLRDTFQTQLKLLPQGSVNGASHYPHVAFFDASSGYNIYQPVSTNRVIWSQLSGTLTDLKSLTSVHPSVYRRGYSHYYVLGSKMSVSFQPTANTVGTVTENNLQVSCGVSRDALFPTAGNASGTSLTGITEARNSSSRQILSNPTGAASKYSKIRLFSTYSPKRLLGIKDTTDNEDLKVSVNDGKANEQTFFWICVQGLNGATIQDPTQQIPMLINVKIDYTLKFVEPNEAMNEPINPM